MIPEITITCSTGKVFINNVTVEQYKKYAALMEKNGSDKITDALFFNKRIIQEIFGNRMSLDELGEVDVIEFLTASKGIHFIMQDIVSDALLNIVETEPIEREASAFDEYDRENGYEDEEQEEQNTCVEPAVGSRNGKRQDDFDSHAERGNMSVLWILHGRVRSEVVVCSI